MVGCATPYTSKGALAFLKFGAPCNESSRFVGLTRVPSKWSVFNTRPRVSTLPCLPRTTLASREWPDHRDERGTGRAAPPMLRDARVARSSETLLSPLRAEAGWGARWVGEAAAIASKRLTSAEGSLGAFEDVGESGILPRGGEANAPWIEKGWKKTVRPCPWWKHPTTHVGSRVRSVRELPGSESPQHPAVTAERVSISERTMKA